ncbi:MAG: hypothetical protein GXX91_03940 [Verrucomicrobiaceae bacterium]|nr:hypothetical protein [Verrucomicrobiaceae bacterium]
MFDSPRFLRGKLRENTGVRELLFDGLDGGVESEGEDGFFCIIGVSSVGFGVDGGEGRDIEERVLVGGNRDLYCGFEVDDGERDIENESVGVGVEPPPELRPRNVEHIGVLLQISFEIRIREVLVN